MRKNGLTSKNGFMMAEAVLSMFVVTTGLVAILALFSSSLRDSFGTRDAIIAVELAQEGVELVRNVRDNGFINSPANPFSNNFFPGLQHCYIDYNSSSLACAGTLYGVISTYVLNYSAGGFYTHASGTPSKFSRYVYINYDSTTQTAAVTSFVYWGYTGSTMPSNITSGSTASCTVANKCVFTNITLTGWRG